MDNPASTIPIPPQIPAPIPFPSPKISTFPVFFTILVLTLLVVTGVFGYQNWQLRQQLNAPTTYEECIKAPGSVLQESYPATCVTRNGERFKQPLTDEEKKKLQPPDSTANWKTYTDKKYGFSFNLPEYYQTENKSWSTDDSVNYLSISPQAGDYPGCCFKKSDPISIQSKAISMEAYQNIGINDWKIKSRFASSHKFIKENIINENSLSFTIFTALNLGQTGFIDDDRLTGFIIQKNSTLIIISVNHYSENQNEAELFINQILSTFKFVDQNETANWKTYTNNKCKYQISYPKSWMLFPEPENGLYGAAILVSYGNEKKPSDNNWLKVQIGCGGVSTGDSPKQTIDKLNARDTGYGIPKVESLGQTTINGKLAYKQITTAPVGDPFLEYYIFADDTSFVNVGFTPSTSRLSTEIQHIISSFKFIK